ncbi:MAG TPA: lysylphosphatidylglycerol synthase transmembrane domain-containing protein [Trueperaceae bacterium]|nr:lysylphosphatidylglycerol synthase transmembrane domain-containing protein [Trueperaceae bacterium]
MTIALLLGLAGLVAVTIWLGQPGSWRQVFSLSAATLAGALLLMLLSFLAGGARLRSVLSLADARVNVWRASRAHVLGLFAAAITPSGGGNGIAIGVALQQDGVKPAVAWSAAVYTMVLDLLFFAWSIPLAAVLLFRASLISQQLLWLALGASLLFLALWYGVAYHLAKLTHLVARLFSMPVLKRWRRPVVRFFEGIGKATGTMARGDFFSQVVLQALTVLLHGAIYTVFYVLAGALGSPLALLPTLALLLIISAASHVVPTPGGAGYFEVALSYAFSQRGAPASVTAAVVAFRVFTYYLPIVLGAVLGGQVLINALKPGQPEPAPHNA